MPHKLRQKKWSWSRHPPRVWWKWMWRIPAILVGLSIWSVVLFRFIPPIITPFMLIRSIQGHLSHKAIDKKVRHESSSGFRIRLKWRSLNNISPHLIRAVIASEDQRFFEHNGFDWEQIAKALAESQSAPTGSRQSKRLRGASTISMQTARNVFLWQGRSWLRKGLEAYFTVLIELIWSKERILEVYLNVVEWGPGIYGAEAAARSYFNCSAKELTQSQSALMAAVLPNPRRWSPARPTPYILWRKQEILQQMANMPRYHF